jgi:hypothetical protein
MSKAGKHEAAGTSGIGLKHPLFQAVWDEDVEALVAIVDEDTDLLDIREQVRVEPISHSLLFLIVGLSRGAPRVLEPAPLSSMRPPCTRSRAWTSGYDTRVSRIFFSQRWVCHL